MKEPVAGEVGRLLRSGNKTLAVAESCTGGLLGHLLTTVPGSSDYFLGGFITYTNTSKSTFLDVPPETIEKHGAVSCETAEAMAQGARRRFGSDYALSVTGIAGPGGGSAEKPVGLIWIGISSANGTRANRYIFQGERTANQRAAAVQALQMLVEHLREPQNGAIEVEVSGVLDGLPRLVAFRWGGARYTIQDYGRSWKDDQRMNWLVRTSPPGVFRVSCDLSGGGWQIERRSDPARTV